MITARTTDTVRAAILAQKASGRTAAHFSDLVTATVLLRETMSPQLRVQGIVRGADKAGSLVADSHPGGATRGLVQLASGHQELKVSGGFMQMMRTLHDGRLQQGIVEIPEQGGISAGMMRYMLGSEQITAVVSVGTLIHGDQVIEAGGYVVQLLPEAREGMLAVMTERLADFPPIESILQSPEFTPALLASELLYAMPHTCTDESAVRFECNCSQVRIIAGLATLSPREIQSLVDEGTPLEITCDFCGKYYQVAPQQLMGLLRTH